MLAALRPSGMVVIFHVTAELSMFLKSIPFIKAFGVFLVANSLSLSATDHHPQGLPILAESYGRAYRAYALRFCSIPLSAGACPPPSAWCALLHFLPFVILTANVLALT